MVPLHADFLCASCRFLMCFLKPPLPLNDLSHCGHGKFRPSMCTSMCSCMCPLFLVNLPQVRHRYLPSDSRSIISHILRSRSSMLSKLPHWTTCHFFHFHFPTLVFCLCNQRLLFSTFVFFSSQFSSSVNSFTSSLEAFTSLNKASLTKSKSSISSSSSRSFFLLRKSCHFNENFSDITLKFNELYDDQIDCLKATNHNAVPKRKNEKFVIYSLFMVMNKFKRCFYHTHTHTLKTHPVHLLCV